MSDVTFDLPLLRARVAALADKGVYIGTSSWKYPGWLGLIYTPQRYETRAKFSQKKFESECLREYAETFRTVCFDGAYYTFSSEAKLREMADRVPGNFRFAFKVTDTLTLKRFPSLPRFGARGGTVNENFLNAAMCADLFLGPLAAIRPNVGPIIFEFSKFYPSDYAHGADFVADLDRFFSALPKGWSFSVELRNRKWLGPDYLACLRKHGVAHVYNNWTDMPPVSEQIGIVGDDRIEELSVARFLLRPGRKYEEAVAKFEPYTHTQEPNDDARGALATLIERGWVKFSRDGTYLYINNRLEGNALMTVLAVLERLQLLAAVRPVLPAPTLAPKPDSNDAKSAAPQMDLEL